MLASRTIATPLKLPRLLPDLRRCRGAGHRQRWRGRGAVRIAGAGQAHPATSISSAATDVSGFRTRAMRAQRAFAQGRIRPDQVDNSGESTIPSRFTLCVLLEEIGFSLRGKAARRSARRALRNADGGPAAESAWRAALLRPFRGRGGIRRIPPRSRVRSVASRVTRQLAGNPRGFVHARWRLCSRPTSVWSCRENENGPRQGSSYSRRLPQGRSCVFSMFGMRGTGSVTRAISARAAAPRNLSNACRAGGARCRRSHHTWTHIAPDRQYRARVP